ncbi:MAG: phosphotransferase family protein [Myxococcota bacterium]
MLDPVADSNPEETARDLCAQIGHRDARLTRARDGREHHLFRVQFPFGERMLKFPRVDALADPYDPDRRPAERLRAEGFAIGLAKGVAVPGDYKVHETTPVCATMTIIPGTTAEIAHEKGQMDEEMLLKVCIQMGKTLAALHSRKRPEQPGLLPDLPFTDPSTARLLHLDFHLGNVMGKPALGGAWTILGVVDWTCARWGPPEADLVEMQVSVFVSNPRARDAFVAGYRHASGRAIDIADLEQRATLEIARRLDEDPPTVPGMANHWKKWVEKQGKKR